MQAQLCKVSIGMPVFNDKLFLQKALDSLLAQTFTDFELIISDDGSTDGSEDICRSYEAKDKRVRYIRQIKNLGISRNMEFLLHEAKGQYFMWAADDDLWDPSFIEILLKGIEANPDACVAFCPYKNIDEQDEAISPAPVVIDYSGKTAFKRLTKLANIFNDLCGYGLFNREKILNVHFPVWWSVNKTKAFNNIYPTICFYLAKGNYILCGEKVLWYNRYKQAKNVHHKSPFPGSFLRGYIAFTMWKFNVVYASLKQVFNASGSFFLLMRTAPLLTWKWWLKPSFKELSERFKSLLEGKISFW